MAKITLNQLADRFDALQVRERVLVVGVALVGCYMLFDLIGFGPTQKKIKELGSSIETQQKHLANIQAEQQVLTRVLASDPNLRLKHELDGLNSHLTALDANIAQLSAGLVPAAQLSVMLQEVLTLTDALQVQEIRTLPPEPINLNSGAAPTAAPPSSATPKAPSAPVAVEPPAAAIPAIELHRQGVKLVVQGTYFQLLDYIKRLEATHWRFYWEGLAYKVTQYPLAQVELKVYTLSVKSGAAKTAAAAAGGGNEN